MLSMHIDPQSSALSFVYPFLFDEREFDARASAVDQAAWSGGPNAQGKLKVWRPEDFCVDDMLSYVADFLNPSEDAAATMPATARLWAIDGNALQSPYGLGGRARWTLMTPRGQIPFHLESVRMALFRDGVGFLTVYVLPTVAPGGGEPEAKQDGVASWLDFIHYFRFVGGQRDIALHAERNTGIDPQTRTPVVQTFVPAPDGPIVSADGQPTDTFTFAHVLRALLRTAESHPQSASALEQASWYKEIFVRDQMLPFVSLFVDGADEDQSRLMLYRVRNFFHAGQAAHPTQMDLSLDNQAMLPYVDRQWFVFSLDGGAFVAFDAPQTDFFRTTMPSHLKDQYFLLFLIALEQRFALMKMQDAVARDWLPLKRDSAGPGAITHDVDEVRRQSFARIRDLLLSFTARSYFTQVMQQEHHHRVYRKWQQTFQVDKLYQEASNAVHDMYTDLQMRHEERAQALAEEQKSRDRQQEERSKNIERALSAIVWVLGVPGLALSYLQTTGSQGWEPGLWVFLGALLLGAIIFVVINSISRPRA